MPFKNTLILVTSSKTNFQKKNTNIAIPIVNTKYIAWVDMAALDIDLS